MAEENKIQTPKKCGEMSSEEKESLNKAVKEKLRKYYANRLPIETIIKLSESEEDKENEN